MKGKAAAPTEEEIEWEVVKPRTAGEIHGRRRAVGDRFMAPKSAVVFEELEGLIRVHAPGAETKKAAKEGAK